MKKYTSSYFYEIQRAMKKSLQVFSLLILSTQLLLANATSGQTIQKEKINLTVEHSSLKTVLKEIERRSTVRFIYNERLIADFGKISIHAEQTSIAAVLNQIFSGSELDFIEQPKNKVIVIERRAEGRPEPASTSGLSEKQILVRGRVTDEKGEPLPGVNVKIKGGEVGALTDTEGRFSISVADPNGTLLFSYIGYQQKEVPVSGNTTINVVLQENVQALQEVVVIGYGTQRRADVTSAVATVKSENFVKAPVLDAGQLLQGKVAGLSVSTPSGDPAGGTQILLRGNTTLYGANSNPLILIDGVPGDLKTVAPEDIASMDVLKDGSAAAIYGTRGTNGVIIITTRRASGNVSNAVEYSGSGSVQTIARELDMLSAEDYRSQIASGVRPAEYDLGSSTDWLKESTQVPVSQVHNLTFRGGNAKTNYLANVNYRALNGIFKKSDNETFTGRVDINHYMFDDKVKINAGFLNSNNKYTTTGDGLSFNGYTYRQALILNPTAPVRNQDGGYFEQPSIFNYENPLSRLYNSDGQNSSQNSRLNAMLTYTPFRALKINALGSLTRWNETRGYAETKQHISTIRDQRNGFASTGGAQSVDRLLELTAEYSQNFEDHRFVLLGGYSYQENESMNMWMQNWDFPTDIFSYHQIGAGDALRRGITPQFSSKSETNLIGFFGRLSYNYKDRYLLLANLRYEAASQLYGTENPWGMFPAVSVGWRITNEPFMKNQKLFTDLKLRAGYGVTGSQPGRGFLGVPLISYQGYVYSNGRWIQTLVPSQNPNPYLKWEEKKESNFGLDYALLNGRISGNVDYYIRRIDGLLYDYQVPSPPNLYNITTANVGVMENKGLEVMLNIIPVEKEDFTWTTSFNFSTNTNKLKSLSNDVYKTTNNYFTSGETGEPIQTFTHIVNVGDNIGDFYGFKVIDVNENGEWIYEGRDGQPVPYDEFQHAFEDKKVLGNGLPKYYAGWNNNLRFKNLDLGVTMRGAFGYQILNFQRMYYENPQLQQYNRLKSAYDKVFDKAVLSNDMPLEFNSHYIENGDFWKVDNITLGYNFSKLNSRYLRSARVFVSTLNTITITGYKGIDPEVNRLGLNPGNDNRDKYPTTRTFTLGVNLSL